ncbi:hypothetical protein [Parasphingorhabdus sp.]|uniref:hypothetical protein n=1 Tax=Parasphingorhabdus sp. TaxID=2709688 RepID=UPI003A9418CC
MSKLLRFLVDYKVSEDSKPLTAYAVAVDALGRDNGFDAQVDSYPRVQIGRLRRMLDHFYLRDDSENRLFIPYHRYEIILGPNETFNGVASQQNGLEPRDEKRGDPSKGSNDRLTLFASSIGAVRSSTILAIFLVTIAIAIGVGYYMQKPSTIPATAISYPAVIVKGSGDVVDPASRAKIETIHSYLVGTLEKFDQVRIFEENLKSTGRSQYTLESSVLNEAADRIQLRLVDSASREVIWSSRFEMTSTEQLEADLDRAVVNIASPLGKIAQHERSKYRDEFTPGYPCLLQFHRYLRYRDDEILKPTLECMEASAQQFSNDSYLMSMLAIAKNISERFGSDYEIDGVGKDYALMAAKLDHDSASATFAVAQSAFFESDCRKGVAWGERAVQLNPLNSRIMGYLGLYMLACNMPEGEAYSTRAIEIDPDVDPAVAGTLAMQKLRRGDAKAAQQLASKYMVSVPGGAPGLEISYILSTAQLGNKVEARRAWRLLAERSDLPETAAPRQVLSRWISNPDLVRQLESDFEKAKLY